jgi:hypothetical protein
MTFMLHPRPCLLLTMAAGATLIGPQMMHAVAEMMTMLGSPRPILENGGTVRT